MLNGGRYLSGVLEHGAPNLLSGDPFEAWHEPS
jgi:hypothetical protein